MNVSIFARCHGLSLESYEMKIKSIKVVPVKLLLKNGTLQHYVTNPILITFGMDFMIEIVNLLLLRLFLLHLPILSH